MTVLTMGWVAMLCSMVIATSATAQTQTPLTSQEPSATTQIQQQAQASAQPTAPLKTVTVPRHVTLIGDATLSILALQRNGQMAAPAQPMLGAEASAAYARYLKSFDHPIPEHLDSSVGTVGGAAGGGASN
ncbi:DUF3613 domain-containing protein [Burkholderia sp. S171]|uniref:DUF3613 domain-containing protein n=1 Tax=Burkholderia sp. S171 TaxID=1641860 RepID=UPI0020B12083|nr:DUF3613 domain-containing protein [Burkholderia sp. S171]